MEENKKEDIVETETSVETTENAEVAITEEADNSEEKKSKFVTNQTVLTIRVLVGGYVAYLGYDIIKTEEKALVSTIFAGLFIVIGAFLVIWSLKKLIKGEYQGGKADIISDDKSIVEADNDTADEISEDKAVEETDNTPEQ